MRKVVWTAVTIYFVVWRLRSSELKDWITFREEGGERDAACISEWNIMAVENKVAIRNDNFFFHVKNLLKFLIIITVLSLYINS